MSPLASLILSTFLCGSAPAAEDPRFSEAEGQVRLLETGNARQRRDAGRKLLELGFYARAAVQKGMAHADPEVAANCAALWKQIETKVSPVDVPGLDAFIKSARENHVNGEAWAQVVKSQGASALLLAEAYLKPEVFAAEEGEEVIEQHQGFTTTTVVGEVERDEKLSRFFSPLLADEGAALLSWAASSAANQDLALKALAMVEPGASLAQENRFLKLLIKLKPEAVLPHLSHIEGLPSAELAKLLLADKAVIDKMKTEGGHLLALSRSLPLVLADSRKAKIEALKALPEDAFVEADEILCQTLVLLGEAGLAAESKKLKAGEGQAGKWRILAEDILAGKIENLAQRCEEMTESDSDEVYHEDVAQALLGNGDPLRQRLASYLFPSNDKDLALAALQVEPLKPDPDLAQMRAQGGLPPEFIAELDKGEKYYQQVNGLGEEVHKAFQRYLIESLLGKAGAAAHLDVALKGAPTSLPLLLEKTLASAPAERSAAVRRLCQALPPDIDLGYWLLDRLAGAKIEPDAAAIQSWLKTLDVSGLKEDSPALSSLVSVCLEKQLDASILLPVMKEPSLDKALLTLCAGRREEAVAILNAIQEEEGKDLSLLLQHLLGAARPEAAKDSELAACLAGLESAPCPKNAEEQKHADAAWELGKGFAKLRKGELKEAQQALEASEKAADCDCVDPWRRLYRVCLGNPELLKPKK
ncbi:MAG: hypothetical protein RL095_3936 [Verrucomicrobiota bacterium]